MIVNIQDKGNKIICIEGKFSKEDEGKFLVIPKIHFYTKVLFFQSPNIFEIETFPSVSVRNIEALIVDNKSEVDLWI
ncbi:MAG: hypothetical protein WA584_06175 [Pyrinomonadaceae bacterium]